MLAFFPEKLFESRSPMIPFDGQFAETIVLPLAEAAYDATQPPKNYSLNQTAFEILADPGHPLVQAQVAKFDTPRKAKRQHMRQSMLKQPQQRQGATTETTVRTLAASPCANMPSGWFCRDTPNHRFV